MDPSVAWTNRVAVKNMQLQALGRAIGVPVASAYNETLPAYLQHSARLFLVFFFWFLRAALYPCPRRRDDVRRSA